MFRWIVVVGVGLATAIASPSVARANVEVWSYSIAVQNGVGDAFPLPEPPARLLSGALWFKADQPVVVIGEKTDKTNDKDMTVGMIFGFAVLSATNQKPSVPSGLECSGDGGAKDPIHVDDAPASLEGIDAAMLCAYARSPEDVWRSSRLIADGQQYVMISEYRRAGQIIFIHSDVTDWAKKSAAGLP